MSAKGTVRDWRVIAFYSNTSSFLWASQGLNSLAWIFMTAQSANFIMSENDLENTMERV